MGLEGQQPEQDAGEDGTPVDREDSAEEQRGGKKSVLAADRIDQARRRKREQQERNQPPVRRNLAQRDGGEGSEQPEGPYRERHKVGKLSERPERRQRVERVDPAMKRQRVAEELADRLLVGRKVEQGFELAAESELWPDPDVDEVAPDRVSGNVDPLPDRPVDPDHQRDHQRGADRRIEAAPPRKLGIRRHRLGPLGQKSAHFGPAGFFAAVGGARPTFSWPSRWAVLTPRGSRPTKRGSPPNRREIRRAVRMNDCPWGVRR